MVDEAKEPKIQPDQEPSKPIPAQPQPQQPSTQPSFQPNADFIAKLAQGIAAANKKVQKQHHHRDQSTALTHLTDAISS